MKTTTTLAIVAGWVNRTLLSGVLLCATLFIGGNAQAQNEEFWTGPGGTTLSPTSGTWNLDPTNLTFNTASDNSGSAEAFTDNNYPGFGGTGSGAIAINVGTSMDSFTLWFSSTTGENYTLNATSPVTLTTTFSGNEGEYDGAIALATGATATIGSNVTVNLAGGTFQDLNGYYDGTGTPGAGGTLDVAGTIDNGVIAGGNVLSIDNVTVNVLAGGTLNTHNLQIDLFGAGSATVNVEGGTISANQDFAVGNASGVTGTLTIGLGGTGGTVTTPQFYIGTASGGTGLVYLDSGTLNYSTFATSPGTANLFFNGGTLQAGADNTAFLSGLTNAYVGGTNGVGGAVIDNNGHNIEIDQTFVTGDGVAGSTSTTAVDGGLLSEGVGSLNLTAANTYTGGTTVAGGTLYVNNTSGSGTGYGGVTVSSGATLAGSGKIAPTTGLGVVVNSGGSLYSGGVPSGTPTTGPGTGLNLDNTQGLDKILTVSGTALTPATLTFALNSGSNGLVSNPSGGGPNKFANPDVDTTYMTVVGDTPGEISFIGSDAVDLVDLTPGATLTLRQGVPFLLIQAGEDTDYSGLVTSLNGTLNDLQLDGDGFVLGVYDGSGAFTNFTPIAINQYGPDGVTLLSASNTEYDGLQLYLFNGDLEVVPEPGTWALLLGGMAVLVCYQRRRRV